MICDKDTNKVFLAEGIKGYEKVAAQLLMKLCDEEIPVEYLPCSKFFGSAAPIKDSPLCLFASAVSKDFIYTIHIPRINGNNNTLRAEVLCTLAN